MNMVKVKKLPTATALESRLRIFQPTQRPVRQTVVVDGPWGKARVTGRLGQRHHDLIEIVRASALKWGLDPAGRVVALVDPYDVSKKMGGGGRQYSYEQMYLLLQDMRETTIEIQTPHIRAMGGLLDEVVEAKTKARNPLTGEARSLMKVVFGNVGTELLSKDLFLFYNPVPITNLRSGMSQAIARHALTHKSEPNGGWHLDTLIKAVAGDIDGVALRKARAAVRKDADGLEACSVIIEGDRVHTL